MKIDENNPLASQTFVSDLKSSPDLTGDSSFFALNYQIILMKQSFTYFIGSRSLFLFVWFFVAMIGTTNAASTSFSGGVLTISFSAANENAVLFNDGTNLTLTSIVSITGAGAVFSTASVNMIVFNDPGSLAGQSLQFGGTTAYTLSGGLDVSGVEIINIVTSIIATGTSSIVVVAPGTISVFSANLTGGSGGVQLVGQGIATLAYTYNHGVQLNTATVTATGVGSVKVEGKGESSASNLNAGVYLSN